MNIVDFVLKSLETRALGDNREQANFVHAGLFMRFDEAEFAFHALGSSATRAFLAPHFSFSSHKDLFQDLKEAKIQ